MRLVRTAILVTVAAAVPLMPATAYADRYVHTDATADVVTVDGSDTVTPAPDRVVGDITSSSIAHKRRNVVMRVQYRDLATDGEYAAHLFIIRTPSMRRDLTLVAGPGFYGGKVIMTKPSGKTVSCHVARRLDYTTNTATVVVPRSCLGRPRWVKVGIGGVLLTNSDGSGPTYVDDAQTTGSLGAAPKYSPKVRR